MVSKGVRQGGGRGVQEGAGAGHPFPDAHFEVDRVHTELLGVEVAELGESTRDVIDVVDSLNQCTHDLLAVRLDLSGAVVQVEVGEVGLGWRVGGEHPGGQRGSGTDETGSQRTGTVVDGETMGTDGRRSGPDRRGDDDGDGHVPLQGLGAVLLGMAADFGEDVLHVGLVVGGQHHGVTSALAAPSTGTPAARRRPYMQCRGTALAPPGPPRSRPRSRPRRPWSPARRGRRPPPPRPAPRPAPPRPTGTGPGWGGVSAPPTGTSWVLGRD